ncbi:hypothetical protein GCM10023322_29770 [Rugosimonospora acidiphila]|uniref:Uncharacterized protein n=1 Tax=Rugosimonospora acidiphila TaxID=556531 RepID=A0ABP9RSJ7_9ACTN
MRAADAVDTVEEKERYRRDTERLGVPGVGLYRVNVFAGGQDPGGAGPVDADLGGQPQQGIVLEHGAPLGEVRPEEPLQQRPLQIVGGGQVQQLVRGQGVTDPRLE